MRSLIRIATLVTLSLLLCAVATAQDRVRISGSYLRTDFPFANAGTMVERVENVNGLNAGFDVQVFKTGGFRGSLAYDFKLMRDQNVYPNYFDGMNIVDLYRNVQTHSGGGQLEYIVRGRVGPTAGLFYGTRKIHRDAPRQVIRTVRLGVNIPFAKESPFFIKGFVDFEQPFGQLPMGFVNPETRTLGVGAGFRF